MKAMRIHKAGGPEEMKWEDVPEPAPGKAARDCARACADIERFQPRPKRDLFGEAAEERFRETGPELAVI